MQLQQRINAFAELGQLLSKMAQADSPMALEVIQKASRENGWFNLPNVQYALSAWGEVLTEKRLKKWITGYSFNESTSHRVGIVMAGNVPLVGFHDFLAVLISGNTVLVKLSSRDNVLLPYLSEQLIKIAPEFKDRIQFTDGKLEGFDAIIATGSNNTARYFDYYFGSHPNIIRRNRNSVAVLTGAETPDQLKGLADDMLRYYGLGCRNVSKLFVPKNYSFEPLFKAVYEWKDLVHEQKYMNNYDYNKAVYLMSLFQILDNEFLLLKEDQGISSPIAVIYYEYYDSSDELSEMLNAISDQTQCLVGATGMPGELAFGAAQKPELWDYADGIDTLEFLTALN